MTGNVAPVFKAVEDFFYERMANGVGRRVGCEILFRDISRMRRVMHQNVIPRRAFGWTRARHLFIPGMRALEDWVDIGNDAAIVEQLMMYQLTDCEFSIVVGRRVVGHWRNLYDPG